VKESGWFCACTVLIPQGDEAQYAKHSPPIVQRLAWLAVQLNLYSVWHADGSSSCDPSLQARSASCLLRTSNNKYVKLLMQLFCSRRDPVANGCSSSGCIGSSASSAAGGSCTYLTCSGWRPFSVFRTAGRNERFISSKHCLTGLACMHGSCYSVGVQLTTALAWPAVCHG
jgi:hypothetical protein